MTFIIQIDNARGVPMPSYQLCHLEISCCERVERSCPASGPDPIFNCTLNLSEYSAKGNAYVRVMSDDGRNVLAECEIPCNDIFMNAVQSRMFPLRNYCGPAGYLYGRVGCLEGYNPTGPSVAPHPPADYGTPGGEVYRPPPMGGGFYDQGGYPTDGGYRPPHHSHHGHHHHGHHYPAGQINPGGGYPRPPYEYAPGQDCPDY